MLIFLHIWLSLRWDWLVQLYSPIYPLCHIPYPANCEGIYFPILMNNGFHFSSVKQKGGFGMTWDVSYFAPFSFLFLDLSLVDVWWDIPVTIFCDCDCDCGIYLLYHSLCACYVSISLFLNQLKSIPAICFTLGKEILCSFMLLFNSI